MVCNMCMATTPITLEAMAAAALRAAPEGPARHVNLAEMRAMLQAALAVIPPPAPVHINVAPVTAETLVSWQDSQGFQAGVLLSPFEEPNSEAVGEGLELTLGPAEGVRGFVEWEARIVP